MALTIVNEQYPPRKPKLTLTADSLDELPTEGVAEGSTATVGGTEYSYDSNAGWIVPGSGGGGSSGSGVMFIGTPGTTMTATWQEVKDALEAGTLVVYVVQNSGGDDVAGFVTVMCLITAAYQGQDGYYISGVTADNKEGAQGGPMLVAETADGVLDTL